MLCIASLISLSDIYQISLDELYGHRRCGTGKLLVAKTGQQQEMLKAPQSMRSFFLTFRSMHSIISYTNHTNYTEMII